MLHQVALRISEINRLLILVIGAKYSRWNAKGVFTSPQTPTVDTTTTGSRYLGAA
jgi:hypothetical protein